MRLVAIFVVCLLGYQDVQGHSQRTPRQRYVEYNYETTFPEQSSYDDYSENDYPLNNELDPVPETNFDANSETSSPEVEDLDSQSFMKYPDQMDDETAENALGKVDFNSDLDGDFKKLELNSYPEASSPVAADLDSQSGMKNPDQMNDETAENVLGKVDFNSDLDGDFKKLELNSYPEASSPVAADLDSQSVMKNPDQMNDETPENVLRKVDFDSDLDGDLKKFDFYPYPETNISSEAGDNSVSENSFPKLEESNSDTSDKVDLNPDDEVSYSTHINSLLDMVRGLFATAMKLRAGNKDIVNRLEMSRQPNAVQNSNEYFSNMTNTILYFTSGSKSDKDKPVAYNEDSGTSISKVDGLDHEINANIPEQNDMTEKSDKNNPKQIYFDHDSDIPKLPKANWNEDNDKTTQLILTDDPKMSDNTKHSISTTAQQLLRACIEGWQNSSELRFHLKTLLKMLLGMFDTAMKLKSGSQEIYQRVASLSQPEEAREALEFAQNLFKAVLFFARKLQSAGKVTNDGDSDQTTEPYNLPQDEDNQSLDETTTEYGVPENNNNQFEYDLDDTSSYTQSNIPQIAPYNTPQDEDSQSLDETPAEHEAPENNNNQFEYDLDDISSYTQSNTPQMEPYNTPQYEDSQSPDETPAEYEVPEYNNNQFEYDLDDTSSYTQSNAPQMEQSWSPQKSSQIIDYSVPSQDRSSYSNIKKYKIPRWRWHVGQQEEPESAWYSYWQRNRKKTARWHQQRQRKQSNDITYTLARWLSDLRKGGKIDLKWLLKNIAPILEFYYPSLVSFKDTKRYTLIYKFLLNLYSKLHLQFQVDPKWLSKYLHNYLLTLKKSNDVLRRRPSRKYQRHLHRPIHYTTWPESWMSQPPQESNNIIEKLPAAEYANEYDNDLTFESTLLPQETDEITSLDEWDSDPQQLKESKSITSLLARWLSGSRNSGKIDLKWLLKNIASTLEFYYPSFGSFKDTKRFTLIYKLLLNLYSKLHLKFKMDPKWLSKYNIYLRNYLLTLKTSNDLLQRRPNRKYRRLLHRPIHYTTWPESWISQAPQESIIEKLPAAKEYANEYENGLTYDSTLRPQETGEISLSDEWDSDPQQLKENNNIIEKLPAAEEYANEYENDLTFDSTLQSQETGEISSSDEWDSDPQPYLRWPSDTSMQRPIEWPNEGSMDSNWQYQDNDKVLNDYTLLSSSSSSSSSFWNNFIKPYSSRIRRTSFQTRRPPVNGNLFYILDSSGQFIGRLMKMKQPQPKSCGGSCQEDLELFRPSRKNDDGASLKEQTESSPDLQFDSKNEAIEQTDDENDSSQRDKPIKTIVQPGSEKNINSKISAKQNSAAGNTDKLNDKTKTTAKDQVTISKIPKNRYKSSDPNDLIKKYVFGEKGRNKKLLITTNINTTQLNMTDIVEIAGNTKAEIKKNKKSVEHDKPTKTIVQPRSKKKINSKIIAKQNLVSVNTDELNEKTKTTASDQVTFSKIPQNRYKSRKWNDFMRKYIFREKGKKQKLLIKHGTSKNNKPLINLTDIVKIARDTEAKLKKKIVNSVDPTTQSLLGLEIKSNALSQPVKGLLKKVTTASSKPEINTKYKVKTIYQPETNHRRRQKTHGVRGNYEWNPHRFRATHLKSQKPVILNSVTLNPGNKQKWRFPVIKRLVKPGKGLRKRIFKKIFVPKSRNTLDRVPEKNNIKRNRTAYPYW